MKNIPLVIFGLAVTAIGFSPLCAQITSFTYQGRLDLNGAPANGRYDFMFRLMSDPTNGVTVPVIPINLAVPVTNGLFTTGIDFGAENFVGANRWLEINVRTNGGGPFTTLSPRQLLTSTPYAIVAHNASNLLGALPAGQISGTIPNASLPASPSFSGTITANSFSGNGAGVTNVNAITLNGLNSSNFWRTAGNAGTIAGTHFLGTTDDQPLEFKVNGERVMRFESGSTGTPNVIGGSPSNYVASGVIGATISGGGGVENGVDYFPNSIAGNFGSIGGGIGNTVTNGPFDTIAGGVGNSIANSPYSTIVGGAGNSIDDGGHFSSIGGGVGNDMRGGAECTIGGGKENTINAGSGASVISGGAYNRLSGTASSVNGGDSNEIENSWASTIAGGFLNRVGKGGYCNFVGGGEWNRIDVSSRDSIIAAGAQNAIGTNTLAGTISGGEGNVLENCDGSTIGGGINNRILGTSHASVISGGAGNEIRTNSPNNVIGGGVGNMIQSNSQFGTIPGGQDNTATNWAFAAGHAAQAIHTGAFVWADSALEGFYPLFSTNANSVTMRASGGYRLFTDPAATSGAFLAAGSGSWTSMSDRNTKENFGAIDTSAVLEKVVTLPVQTWNYKSQVGNVRHIGPTAQDFKAAFGVGESDTGISNVDADGVALAAIQGLNQKLETARAENAKLTARLEKLEALVGNLPVNR